MWLIGDIFTKKPRNSKRFLPQIFNFLKLVFSSYIHEQFFLHYPDFGRYIRRKLFSTNNEVEVEKYCAIYPSFDAISELYCFN